MPPRLRWHTTMTEPDDVPGASQTGEATRWRANPAKVLVHALTGDSWGLQDALINYERDELIDGFFATWPLLWESGALLRRYLTEDERERVVGRLRQQIANQALAEETTLDD
jgi:hypothetical protein